MLVSFAYSSYLQNGKSTLGDYRRLEYFIQGKLDKISSSGSEAISGK